MQPPRVLTRRELYDLVWSKPIRDLAAEFGESDRGLAKICERHHVPTPDRGYWAKFQAVKTVVRASLENIADPWRNRIEIRSTTFQFPKARVKQSKTPSESARS